MKIEIELPTWLLRELNQVNPSTSYQANIKQVLKHYLDVMRKNGEGMKDDVSDVNKRKKERMDVL